MSSWFEGIFGADYGAAVMWLTYGVLALVAVVAIIWIVRRAMSGTFVAGGRNRKPRLAVLDAAAVDSHRRLVLIRRDDTEHLVMIGGPTDIVVERGINSTAELERTPAPPKAIKTDSPTVTKPAPAVAKPEPAKVAAPADPAKTATVAPTAPKPSDPMGDRMASRQLRETEAAPAIRPGVGTHTGEHGATVGAVSSSDTLYSRSPVEPPAPRVAATSPAEPANTILASDASETQGKTAQDMAAVDRTAQSLVGDKSDLDVALLRELESTLDKSSAKTGSQAPETADNDLAELGDVVSRERA